MSTRRALFFSLLDRYAGLLLLILSSMVIARLLTPTEIGVFSVAMVLIMLISSLRDLGAGQYLVQAPELTPECIRATWTVLLGTGLFMSAVLLLAAGPVARFYGEPRLLDIMRVLAANVAITPFGAMTYAWLTREMRFDALAVIRLGGSLAGACTAVFLAWRGHGPISLAFGNLASTVVGALIARRFRPAHLACWPGWTGVRQVVGIGSTISARTLILNLAAGAPELLLGMLQSLGAAGLYSRSSGLSMTFQRLVLDAAQGVALPLFARAQRQQGNLNEALLQTTSLVTALGWSFFLGLALMAYPLTRLLYGDQWDASVIVTQMLALGMGIGLSACMCPLALMAAGRNARVLQATLSVVAIQVVSVAIGAWVGLAGAGVGFAVAQVFSLAIWLSAAQRHLGFPWHALRAVLLRSAALSGLTTLAPLTVVSVFGLEPDARLAPLLCSFIGGVAVFALAARWLQHPIQVEIDRLAQQGKTWWRGLLSTRKPMIFDAVSTPAGRWMTGGDPSVSADVLREIHGVGLVQGENFVVERPSGPVFVKCYIHRQFTEQVWARGKAFFGKSKGRSEFQNSQLLLRHGVAVATPLAYAERVRSIRCTESLVISRFLSSARLATDALRDEHDRQARVAIIRALGEVVAKLHSEGLFHGDLHLGNVLITQAGGRTSCHLIDCGSNARAPRQRYRIEDDLAEILFSAQHVADWSDWRVFMRCYARHCRLNTDRRHLRISLARLQCLWPQSE